jgi:hypothetical protein
MMIRHDKEISGQKYLPPSISPSVIVCILIQYQPAVLSEILYFLIHNELFLINLYPIQISANYYVRKDATGSSGCFELRLISSA